MCRLPGYLGNAAENKEGDLTNWNVVTNSQDAVGQFMGNDGSKKQEAGQYAQDNPLLQRRVRRLYPRVKHE